MYAVVEIKGKQFKVTSGAEINIPKTDAEEGDKLTYNRVLYMHNGKDPVIGTPTIDGATVEATVLGHGKSKKVMVFKKKRRNNYRRKRGHRQQFTSVRIDDIKAAAQKKSKSSKSSKKKSSKKPEANAEASAEKKKSEE
ncbi:MAG: 50S ribosomal protein L21 [Candidatus Marinimicrobia bacterium]|nr:50S ribosomal protein L21 [Candidatus Neomarinimicrobiota bacterium]